MKNKLILISIILTVVSCANIQSSYVPKRVFSECYTTDECARAIQIAITDNWSRPKSARNGLEVMLILSLFSDGNINSISIEKSSGDEDFDASAVSAVEKASPFTEISSLDQTIYNEDFKKFKLLFTPVDLVK